MTRTLKAIITVLISTVALQAPGFGAEGSVELRPHWFRCNTHTHTSNPPHSDANETPEFVADWYYAHGYQCVVITDHEFLTDVTGLNQKYLNSGEFLVIRGQEITQQLVDPTYPGGVRQLHVNGINLERAIMPIGYPGPARGISAKLAYERNMAAIVAAGGIAQVNHPNLEWSVHLEDLLPLSQPFLFEVWNAFPTSNNLGGTDDGGTRNLSTEELWDGLLSSGKVVWAVGSDDAHDYQHMDDRETPGPGKAWIMIQAASLTVADIMDALRRGHFYATTGITLASYVADERGIAMEIAPSREWSPALKPSARYRTRFVGANGRVLLETTGHSAQYRFNGTEQYVRAAIIDSDGRRAWTQPIFLDGRRDMSLLVTTRNAGTRRMN